MTSPRPRPASRPSLLLMALLTSMLWSGCAHRIVIVPSDDTVVRLKSGTAYTPAADGWYMTDSLYLRYRRAVADKIAESTSKPVSK